MRGNLKFSSRKEKLLILAAFFLGVFLVFLAQAEFAIVNPASNTNYTTTFFFNVTYTNVTDVTTPINASIYYNGTFLGNASVTCSSTACGGNRSINSTFDGVWNINITLGNASLVNGTTGPNSTAQNVRFDSSKPEVQEANISSPATGRNVSGTLILNVSAIDLGIGVQRILFNVTNSSGSQNGTYLASNPSGNAWNASLNTAVYPDGLYNITVYANDTLNNLNNTARVYSVRFDNTNPSISVSKSSSSTKTTLVLDITATDASSINISCTTDRAGASVTGSGSTHTSSESGLACGTNYTYNVYCRDTANNLGSTSGSFGTNACSASDVASSSSSTATASVTTWKSTFVAAQAEVSSASGYSKELASQERVSLIVVKAGVNETHHVGVLNITSGKAKIQVTSTPQEAELAAGESKKFEVTGDNYYDLSVTLNSITGSKANVTIQSINEMVPAGQQQVTNATPETSGAVNASAQEEAIKEKNKNTWVWVITIFIVLAAAVAFGVLKKKKN